MDVINYIKYSVNWHFKFTLLLARTHQIKISSINYVMLQITQIRGMAN